MTRVYVPATVHMLALLESDGSMEVGDDVVVAQDDSEEAEYDALMAAAETSAVLVAGLDPGERRRVVVVAEVDTPGDIRADTPAGTPANTLHLSKIVAVHADADDLPPVADPEDLDDLGWYATQEIPSLLHR